MKINDFTTEVKPTWCPGCGNYAILNAIKMALAKSGLAYDDLAIAYGIGCAGNTSNLLKACGIETLHGRPVAVAEGIKLANNRLNVLAIAGDGDSFGIGASHIIHAARRNIDITLIVFDNHRYSLTTGQASPTTDLGDVTKTTLMGNIEDPYNPIAMALSADASFVARGFAGWPPAKLADLILEAINHKGFSLIDILQPCVTFNEFNTFSWYQKRLYDLPKTYLPNSRTKAFVKALEWGEKIPAGIFYDQTKPTYEGQQPQLSKKPLMKADLGITNLSQLMDEFV